MWTGDCYQGDHYSDGPDNDNNNNNNEDQKPTGSADEGNRKVVFFVDTPGHESNDDNNNGSTNDNQNNNNISNNGRSIRNDDNVAVLLESGFTSDEDDADDLDEQVNDLGYRAPLVMTTDGVSSPLSDSLIVPDEPPAQIRTASAIKAMQSFPASRHLSITPKKAGPVPPAEVDV